MNLAAALETVLLMATVPPLTAFGVAVLSRGFDGLARAVRRTVVDPRARFGGGARS